MKEGTSRYLTLRRMREGVRGVDRMQCRFNVYRLLCMVRIDGYSRACITYMSVRAAMVYALILTLLCARCRAIMTAYEWIELN